MATHQALKKFRVPQALSGRAKTGFEKWQDTVNESRYSSRWSMYDAEIKNIVNEYNKNLNKTPGYHDLNWKFIKAMIWVESGGPDNPAWRSRPIQIGNKGDPGLRAFFSDNEGGYLILPPVWKGRLNMNSAISNPIDNIRAGVGLLLMKQANKDVRVVMDKDSRVYTIEVHDEKTLSELSKKNSSTVEVMKKMNPEFSFLKRGQIWKYKKSVKKELSQGGNYYLQKV